MGRGPVTWTGGEAWVQKREGSVVALQDLLFRFFEEAWRVAKPGANFEVRCPNWQHAYAHGDPTHRRTISFDLINYLGKNTRRIREVEFYDVDCNWEGKVDLTCDPLPGETPLEASRRIVRECNGSPEIVFRLTAIKD